MSITAPAPRAPASGEGLAALIPTATAPIVERLTGEASGLVADRLVDAAAAPSPVTLAIAGHLLARAATGPLAEDERRLAATVADILSATTGG